MSGARLTLRGFGLRHPGRLAWALRGVDLSVEPGERVLLLGASGSGKSTLLRAAAGLVDPAAEVEGFVAVDGTAATDPAARSRVGLVLQDPDSHLLLPRVVDDVAFGLRNRGTDPVSARCRAHEALAEVGLHVADGRRTSALSGGERQRVALAGVVALRPDLVLLDEPTSMLDEQGAIDLRRAVHRIAAGGRTLVVVEHRVDQWRDLVDRVVVLASDGVVADGPPDTVLSDTSLERSGVWVRPPPRAGAGDGSRPVVAREELLRADAVTWRYPGAPAEALQPTSATVDSGCVLAVTGRNGSGKSSLLALVGGLRRPTTGTVTASVRLRSGLTRAEPHRWRSRDLAGRVGCVGQNPEDAFVTRRVDDEVAVGVQARAATARAGAGTVAREPRSSLSAGVDDLLDVLGLGPLAAANPFTLSGGQQRRLSVAAAVAAGPSVLLLDEPTFGQDPVTWTALRDLLARFRDDGGAVVLATHDPWLVAALADDRLDLPSAVAPLAAAAAPPGPPAASAGGS